MKAVKKSVALLLALVTLLTLPVAALAVTPAAVEDLLTFVPVGAIGNPNYHYEITGNTITGRMALTIPATYEGYKVTAIRKEAFKNCGYITSLTIPAEIATVKGSAFEGCLNLKNVAFEGTDTVLSASAFRNCEGLETVTLPSALTAIPDSCFESCVNLRTCAIPATVTKIGMKAFSNCENLEAVTLGRDVASLGDEAFAACSSITAFTVDTANTAFKSENGVLFSKDGKALINYPGGKSVTNYTMPAGVTAIQKMAFAKNGNLQTVTLADSVKEIEEYAFSQAAALKTVTLNSGLTTIGEKAFQRCGNMKSVTLPATLTVFDSAFFAGGLETVTLTEGITAISQKAFDSCAALKTVNLPASLTAIELGAFHNCTQLTYLELAETVTDIDEEAFNGADNLVLGVYFASPAYVFAVKKGIPFITLDAAFVKLQGTVSQLAWESSAAFSALPAGAELVWSSSNPAAVTVDENGRVTAVGKGSAVIRASLKENQKVYDEITVTVTFTFWQKIVYFFRNLFSFLR